MPSETASSASPRYLRTLGTSSSSPSSRQSRMASAISVGVSSSSPASSATELTSAIAFRIRSAAARCASRPPAGPLLVGRLARPDHDPSLRLLADARARDVGVALQGEMDRAALEWLHRVERDGVAGHLHLAGGAHRDLADGVLAALAVALHVDDDALAFLEVPADHHVGHRLQGAQGLATPADEGTQVATRDVERDGLGTWANRDLGADAHVLEEA